MLQRRIAQMGYRNLKKDAAIEVCHSTFADIINILLRYETCKS